MTGAGPNDPPLEFGFQPLARPARLETIPSMGARSHAESPSQTPTKAPQEPKARSKRRVTFLSVKKGSVDRSPRGGGGGGDDDVDDNSDDMADLEKGHVSADGDAGPGSARSGGGGGGAVPLPHVARDKVHPSADADDAPGGAGGHPQASARGGDRETWDARGMAGSAGTGGIGSKRMAEVRRSSLTRKGRGGKKEPEPGWLGCVHTLLANRFLSSPVLVTRMVMMVLLVVVIAFLSFGSWFIIKHAYADSLTRMGARLSHELLDNAGRSLFAYLDNSRNMTAASRAVYESQLAFDGASSFTYPQLRQQVAPVTWAFFKAAEEVTSTLRYLQLDGLMVAFRRRNNTTYSMLVSNHTAPPAGAGGAGGAGGGGTNRSAAATSGSSTVHAAVASLSGAGTGANGSTAAAPAGTGAGVGGNDSAAAAAGGRNYTMYPWQEARVDASTGRQLGAFIATPSFDYSNFNSFVQAISPAPLGPPGTNTNGSSSSSSTNGNSGAGGSSGSMSGGAGSSAADPRPVGWDVFIGQQGVPILQSAQAVRSPVTGAVVGLSMLSSPLAAIGRHLSGLNPLGGAFIYIALADGRLVAISTGAPTYRWGPDGRMHVINVADVDDPEVRQLARRLEATYGLERLATRAVNDTQICVGARTFFVDTLPLHYDDLRLFAVVMVPRAAVFGQVDRENRKILLILVFTAAAILLAGWVVILGLTLYVAYRMRPKEELLRQQEETRRAQAASEVKSQFLANISHDLRTPMAGIIGLLDIMLCDRLTAEQEANLRQMKSCAASLLGLLNNLLDLAKVEAGKMQLEVLEFDIVGELESLVDMFSVQGLSNHTEIALDLADDIERTVKGDPSRVRQVFANLLSNACKFTKEGHVLVRGWMKPPPGGNAHTGPGGGLGGAVARSASLGRSSRRSFESTASAGTTSYELFEGDTGGDEGGEGGGGRRCVTFVFEVDDTGPGIPPEKRDLVFEKFQQADVATARTHGGTGLGLGIVRSLVRLMGGHIAVVEKQGRGACFRFELSFGRSEEGSAWKRDMSTPDFLMPKLSSVEGGQVLLAMGESSAAATIATGWMQRRGLLVRRVSLWDELLPGVRLMMRSRSGGSSWSSFSGPATLPTAASTSSAPASSAPGAIAGGGGGYGASESMREPRSLWLGERERAGGGAGVERASSERMAVPPALASSYAPASKSASCTPLRQHQGAAAAPRRATTPPATSSGGGGGGSKSLQPRSLTMDTTHSSPDVTPSQPLLVPRGGFTFVNAGFRPAALPGQHSEDSDSFIESEVDMMSEELDFDLSMLGAGGGAGGSSSSSLNLVIIDVALVPNSFHFFADELSNFLPRLQRRGVVVAWLVEHNTPAETRRALRASGCAVASKPLYASRMAPLLALATARRSTLAGGSVGRGGTALSLRSGGGGGGGTNVGGAGASLSQSMATIDPDSVSVCSDAGTMLLGLGGVGGGFGGGGRPGQPKVKTPAEAWAEAAMQTLDLPGPSDDGQGPFDEKPWSGLTPKSEHTGHPSVTPEVQSPAGGGGGVDRGGLMRHLAAGQDGESAAHHAELHRSVSAQGAELAVIPPVEPVHGGGGGQVAHALGVKQSRVGRPQEEWGQGGGRDSKDAAPPGEAGPGPGPPGLTPGAIVVSQQQRRAAIHNHQRSRSRSEKQSEMNHDGSLTGRHVLIAEDTALLKKVAVIRMQKLGCTVETVSNGQEAFDAVLATYQTENARPPFDAVLMDCQMPVMDGYAATLAIRAAEKGTPHHTPIVALTAHAMTSDERKCLDAGMDAYLTKPIDPALMATTLLRLMGPLPN